MLLLIGAALAAKGVAAALLLKPAAWEHWLSPGRVDRRRRRRPAAARRDLAAPSRAGRRRDASRCSCLLLTTLLAPDLLFARPPLSMFAWSYGHLLHFNGLTHLVLLCWPVVATAYLFALAGSRTGAASSERRDGRSAIVARMVPPAVDDAIDPARVRRALVIKLRHHGDVLLSSPVFTVLKRAAPHAEIDALVYLETAPMLERHPAISIVHTIDRSLKSRGPLAQLAGDGRLWRALRARHYDLVVHLTEHPRGAWMSCIAGARWSVAPERERAGWFWRSCFTHRYPLPQSTPRHVVEADLDALRRIGIWPRGRRQEARPRSGPRRRSTRGIAARPARLASRALRRGPPRLALAVQVPARGPDGRGRRPPRRAWTSRSC